VAWGLCRCGCLACVPVKSPEWQSPFLDCAGAASKSSVLFCAGSGVWPHGAKFARHVSRDLSGIKPDLAQQPGDWDAHSDEMQTGLRAWNTVLSDRCEMADERLEPRVVAGGRHNGVRKHA
jgi:hypothetical protein